MQIVLPSGETAEFRLPEDFDDHVWDAKGYFAGAELACGGRLFRLTFFEPTRLAQGKFKRS